MTSIYKIHLNNVTKMIDKMLEWSKADEEEKLLRDIIEYCQKKISKRKGRDE